MSRKSVICPIVETTNVVYVPKLTAKTTRATIHSGAMTPKCWFRGKRRNQRNVHECHSVCMLVTLQIIILLLMRQKPGQRSIIASEGCFQAHSVLLKVIQTARSH